MAVDFNDFMNARGGNGIPYLDSGDHTLVIHSIVEAVNEKDRTKYWLAKFVVGASDKHQANTLVRATWDVYGQYRDRELARFRQFLSSVAGTEDVNVLRALFDQVFTPAQPARGRTVKCSGSSRTSKNGKLFVDKTWSAVADSDTNAATYRAHLDQAFPLNAAPAPTPAPAAAPAPTGLPAAFANFIKQ